MSEKLPSEITAVRTGVVTPPTSSGTTPPELDLDKVAATVAGEDAKTDEPETIEDVYGGADPTTGKRRPGRPKGSKNRPKMVVSKFASNEAPVEADPNARGWRRYSKRMYDGLLSAFRVHPGNYSRASKLAGCSVEMARTAWVKGWSDKPGFSWATPISQVIEEELGLGRAKAQERLQLELAEKDAQRERERVAAMAVTEAEKQLMQSSRQGLQAVHDVCTGLLTTAQALAAAIKKAVAHDILDPTTGGLKSPDQFRMSPEKMIHLIRKISEMQRDAVTVSARLVELGRLERGEATAIHDHRVDITPEEAERELAELEQVYISVTRAKALGDVQVDGSLMMPEFTASASVEGDEGEP